MNHIQLCQIVRFELYQHIPPYEKKRVIRHILQTPLYYKVLQDLFQETLKLNQFTELVKVLHNIRVRKSAFPRYVFLDKDLDEIIDLYMTESDPKLASTILDTLYNFTVRQSNHHVWDLGLNLLYSARSKEDKQSAILFMVNFQTPV